MQKLKTGLLRERKTSSYASEKRTCHRYPRTTQKMDRTCTREQCERLPLQHRWVFRQSGVSARGPLTCIMFQPQCLLQEHGIGATMLPCLCPRLLPRRVLRRATPEGRRGHGDGAGNRLLRPNSTKTTVICTGCCQPEWVRMKSGFPA